MGNQMHVQVPADLWEFLDREDFDSVDSFRSPDQWAQVAQGVITVADQGLGVGANLVTVILGRDAIASFVEQVRTWSGRRRAAEPLGGFAAELTVRVGDTESRVTITRTGPADSAAEPDTEALARLLASAMSGSRSEDRTA
ncbi:hypothetical protein ACFWU3_25600 [Streptomyces sp. NPDC058685]|uniref:hypothetical protein n=1 Tax=Streptomyces sp. NPDC058685 TaxID=3346598 RepID=UPI00364B56FE